jgi:hypothetical protein
VAGLLKISQAVDWVNERFGVVAEGVDLPTGGMLGKSPRACSHVGSINSALSLSRRWAQQRSAANRSSHASALRPVSHGCGA